MKRKNAAAIAVVACIAIALAIMASQWVVYPGHWFDVDQVMHHETFAIVLVAIGATIVIMTGIKRR